LLWLFVFCFFAQRTNAGPAGVHSAVAQLCGVDESKPSARVFADPDGKDGWHEYRTARDVPEMTPSFSDFASLSVGKDGKFLIQMMEPGEDFDTHTDYCFDKPGNLLQLGFELKTYWGWGFREQGPIEKGVFHPGTSEFFDTKTERVISKPGGADDIPDALKPRFYLQETRLPFWKLVSRAAKTNTEVRPR
jgi:hypothetical protein